MAIKYGSEWTTSSGNSTLRVCCNYTESVGLDGVNTASYYYYLEVTKGDFEGSTGYVDWYDSTFKINGIGTYQQSATTTVKINPGKSYQIPAMTGGYANYSDRRSTVGPITLYGGTKTSFTHTINHYLLGFNGENNTLSNGNLSCYVLGQNSVSIGYGDSININTYKMTVPNGFYFDYMQDGSSTSYYHDSNYTYKQGQSSATFNYYYSPYDYNIIYNTNGGMNHSGNPSTYNILYGKNLLEPTRTNYTFIGWTDQNGNFVSAINENADAEFSSIDMMYDELESRTTGDIALTANWTGNGYTVTLNANGGISKTDVVTVFYESDLNSNIEIYTPTRQGYEFLGWFSSPAGGIQVYDKNGLCTNEGTYWSDNICVYPNDYILYAQWKPLNIGYLKSNGKWALCNTYVKVADTWEPAIMKIKTDGDWDYQIYLTDDEGNLLTDEEGNYLYKL